MKNRILPTMAILGILFFIAVFGLMASIDILGNASDKTNEMERPHLVVETNGDKTLSNAEIYDSFLDFSYMKMRFVNDDEFEILKDLYEDIDFFGEFKWGNLEKYDFYVEQYQKLLSSASAFVVEDVDEEFFLKDYGNFKIDFDADRYDLNDYIYYFFDVDEDETPELCIVDRIHGIYIFKYNLTTNKFVLWKDMSPSYYKLNGSLKIRWNREGISHVFSILNEEAKEICTVSFFSREEFDKETGKSEVIYMVSLPRYSDIVISTAIESMKEQGYYDKGKDLYYFKVTEIQYVELTASYFGAEELALEKLNEITFTYEELFGDL